MTAIHKLEQFRRPVIKIGSSLLVDAHSGRLDRAWLATLGEDIADLISCGAQPVIVSSGAIALGRRILALGRKVLKLEEDQAAAAAGQIALSRAYSQVFEGHGLHTGQILLTPDDTEQRRRYLNARSTIETLLALKAVPVINENDTVATSEIRYGDNDRLAARVASMISADVLVLLSDVDGLYTAPPKENPKATLVKQVNAITPQIMAMAGGQGSHLSRGGMKTKIEAAKIATSAGATMIIAHGHAPHPLSAIKTGAACTWFLPRGTPIAARKRWIAGTLAIQGQVIVDDGALAALKAGRSLLPAGVRRITGHFSRGDAVAVVNGAGDEIARGLIAYDADDAGTIAGCNSADIERLLGFKGRDELIHRDNLVLLDDGDVAQAISGACTAGIDTSTDFVV